MRALQVTQFKTSPEIRDIPMPEPGAGQVRLLKFRGGIARFGGQIPTRVKELEIRFAQLGGQRADVNEGRHTDSMPRRV